MRVIIGADHAGFEMKAELIAFAQSELGLQMQDVGTHSSESCDFPPYAQRVAQAVAHGEADLGVLICGTGVGVSIAANKVPGAYAARCGDTYSARMARSHNAANILCLGGRVIGIEIAKDVLREFLLTPEDDAERHQRRRRQIMSLETNGETGG